MEQRKTTLHGQPEDLAWLWQIGQASREYFASKTWAHVFEGVGCNRDVFRFCTQELGLPLQGGPRYKWRYEDPINGRK